MKIKIEIEYEPRDQVRPVVAGDQPRGGLDPLVIIGQGPYATLYTQDPEHPGRVVRRRPDGTLIDRKI
tara:strand:- start:3082 stop:3285 length:204 start_codon:yes stop_codon:yes gene_type:complete